MTGSTSDIPGDPGTLGPLAAPGGPGRGRPSTRLILIAGGVLVLALVVLLFFVGLRVGESTSGSARDGSAAAPADAALTSPGASAAPTPSSAADSTPTAAPDADLAAPPGPLAPGTHAWDALHGGECLTGYTSPWAEEFTVVDCAEPHPAQLVSTGVFAEDATAPYPGEAELTSRLNLLCTAPVALDYAAAEALADLQWQASYPADDAGWTSGARGYSCFFTRSSVEPLTGSLAAVPAG